MTEITNEQIQILVDKYADVKEAYNSAYGIATQEDFAESDLFTAFDNTNDAIDEFHACFLELMQSLGIKVSCVDDNRAFDLEGDIIVPFGICK